MEDRVSTVSKESFYSPVSFKFFGNAAEFWKIWIVNVLLSIVTLGIYSAWAKVRTQRYLFGNTELDGHRFNYLATPMQVLKGRIIAVILFGGYYFVATLFPIAALVLLLVMVALAPWMICASMRFKLRMTSYRNIRFDFTGKYGQAFVNFILLPIASLFTLYLALPWVLKRIDTFLISNTRYGNKSFQPQLSSGKYYSAAFITFILMLVVFFIIGFVLAGLGFALPNAEAGEAPQFSWLLLGLMAGYIIILNVVMSYYQTKIRNHIFKQTEIDNVAQFDSNFTFSSLAWLQLTNLLAVLCTFGLALPWAKIRAVNYAIARTEVSLSEHKDDIFEGIIEEQSSIGDEVANAFDIDIALT